MTSPSKSAEQGHEGLIGTIPLSRLGTPGGHGRAAVFLAPNDSSADESNDAANRGLCPDRRLQDSSLERFMAKRLGAKTNEINASHLAIISQPNAITNLII
jgi:hypothetical protein